MHFGMRFISTYDDYGGECSRTVHLTREELDAFAAESQQKCERAQAADVFADEIVPVPVKVKKNIIEFSKDEGRVPERQRKGCQHCAAVPERRVAS